MKVSSDLSLLFSAFASIFLAELGDKTQLATMALSGDAANAHSRWVVFIAASLALITASAIGVLAGAALTRFVSPSLLQRAAGALFVVMGLLMLVRRTG
jgi:putative Ca2+/H+ antiporter (TMEM165/GDT1 family)